MNIPVHREPLGTPVAEIGRRGIAAAKRLGLDLVILDRNPLKVERTTIKEILVQETIKEGRTVYQRK